MESKFEILSYQNCNDLKKAINPSSVLIGACTLLLGLYLAFFVSVSDPTSNLNMLRLAAGWVLAGFGLVTLVFNPRRWVYDPTGSPVGKRSLDFGMEQLPALRRMLKDTGFDDVQSTTSAKCTSTATPLPTTGLLQSKCCNTARCPTVRSPP